MNLGALGPTKYYFFKAYFNMKKSIVSHGPFLHVIFLAIKGFQEKKYLCGFKAQTNSEAKTV